MNYARRGLQLDKISPASRSANMRAIRSSDTEPEMLVRRLVYHCGFRYRLHRRDLPGKPDLVFPSRKAVIFVHGCFWHMHNCLNARPPKSNTDYWLPKLEKNQQRDRTCVAALEAQGWRVLTIWDCETKDVERLERRIKAFLTEN